MIKLSDFVAKYLREKYNIRHVFMVTGGGAMHLNDSFGKYIPYTCNHHEQACAIAAEGYARVHQELAVVNVTTGPGGLNCLNGVFGQWTDSVPVLYISGQVKRATMMSSYPEIPLRQLGDQEVDIISVVKPITKYATILNDKVKIKYVLDKAVYLATHGRKGPVWIDIPIDLQAAIIDKNNLVEYNSCEDLPSFPNIDNELLQLKNLYCKAQRPLIIAGHGIRLSGAIKEFTELIDKLKIPVVTTMNGFDIVIEDHPCFISRIGTVANRAGNFALQNADLIISIGTRNNIRQISYNYATFAQNAKLAVVDIDVAELNKPTITPDIKIHADALHFINMAKDLPAKKQHIEWNNFCKSLKKKYPPLTEAPRMEHKPLEPYFFIDKLIDKFKEREVVVCANGSAFLIPFQVGKVKKFQRYIWNSGNASMGYGLPAAIGACIANNCQRTICLEGDGSIMMNLQELQTVKHYNLPIKIFVLNNEGYSSIRQTQQNFFDGRMTGCSASSGVSVPDFVEVGRAFGLKTLQINSPDNLDGQIQSVLESEGPILCEVKLTPNYTFAPKLSAKQLPDGTMVSPSLEDMYPFLPREEFEENMLPQNQEKN